METNIVKNCKLCGPLTKEQVWFKKDRIQCKKCAQTEASNRRKNNPELHRSRDLKNKYMFRSPDITHLFCSTCKEEKEIKFFHKHMINIRYPYCKVCKKIRDESYKQKYHEQYSLKERNRKYLMLYNIDLEQYNNMKDKQNNSCAICGLSKSYKDGKRKVSLCVDHCHLTGKVRGLLCQKCNVGLALLQDCPKILMKAIEYLKFHS